MSYPLVRIGSVFEIRNGGTPASGESAYWDGDIPWVTPADLGRLSGRQIARGERNISRAGLENSNAQIVPRGTIILSIRAPIGHVAIASQPLSFNQGCRGLIPRSYVDSKYAYYAFIALRPQLQAAGQGTTFQELSRIQLARERIPLPDIEAQRRIADFLDRETARIDDLMSKKQRMLDILDLKERTLIDRALTHGASSLNESCEGLSNVPDRVPCHWVNVALKWIADIRYGIGEPPEYRTEGIPLIRATNIRRGKISLDDVVFVNPSDIPESRIVWLSPGDILVVRSGVYTGDSALVRVEHCPAIAGFDMVVTPKKCEPEFLQYALLSSRVLDAQIGLQKTRAAQPHLNAKELGSCRIWLPPREEQKKIVRYLNSELERLERLRIAMFRSIDKLRELRYALVTEAVTGQSDVDEWQRRGETERRIDNVGAEVQETQEA